MIIYRNTINALIDFYSCNKGHTKFVLVLQIFVQARPKLFLIFQFDVHINMYEHTVLNILPRTMSQYYTISTNFNQTHNPPIISSYHPIHFKKHHTDILYINLPQLLQLTKNIPEIWLPIIKI